jgi:ribonuclease G
MAKLLLISVAECDTRVALVEDGRAAEFYRESHSQASPAGNIYKGRVLKLLPGMAAAFVDVGLERPAYLYAEEAAAQEDEFFELWLKEDLPEGEIPPRPPAPAIQDLLHEGQEILVQVIRGPVGTKGARLTTRIALAGHYLVFLPTLPHLGVSRRLPDEGERQRLKALLAGLKPRRGGLIARTASRGQSYETLAREREDLAQEWARIRRRFKGAAAPASLHQELEAARRWVRELFSPELDRLLVDDPPAFEKVAAYLESLNPLDRRKLELYDGPEPLFSHFGLEVKWDRLLAPRVWLKSGGYLLLDSTQALTAVDVNTGRFVGRHRLKDTILTTNLEAARELARQLRLRNIGGLIVVDFIDMEDPAHREQVHQELLAALKPDRAKTTVLPISPLGLLEMTRQHLGESLAQSVAEPCAGCGGAGVVLTDETLACDALRHLSAEAREFPGCRLAVTLHPQVAGVLQEAGKALLKRLARDHQAVVEVRTQPQAPREHLEITREF